MEASTSKNEKPSKKIKMTSKDCRGVIYSFLSVKELAGTISRLSKYERKLLQELKEPGSFSKLEINFIENDCYAYECNIYGPWF